MKLDIIVPVKNEEGLVGRTLQRLEGDVRQLNRIIVVMDHCEDNSIIEVESVMRDFDNIVLIHNHKQGGFVSALEAGFREVKDQDVLVPVMADSCDQFEIIDFMFDRIKEGYDVISTSRYLKDGRRIGGSKIKRWFSRNLSKLVNLFIDGPITDYTNSFKMYRKYFINNIRIKSKSFEVSMELSIKAFLYGYKIIETPTLWKERDLGKSKFHYWRNGIRYFQWILFALSNYYKRRDRNARFAEN